MGEVTWQNYVILTYNDVILLRSGSILHITGL